jgi:hypothetical protein
VAGIFIKFVDYFSNAYKAATGKAQFKHFAFETHSTPAVLSIGLDLSSTLGSPSFVEYLKTLLILCVLFCRQYHIFIKIYIGQADCALGAIRWWQAVEKRWIGLSGKAATVLKPQASATSRILNRRERRMEGRGAVFNSLLDRRKVAGRLGRREQQMRAQMWHC